MARKLLSQVRVATPCHVAWSEMQGDDRMRHCSLCKHNVFNLSDMDERQAEDFLRAATGRTCVRYYHRADGTVITRDCPVGLRAVRRRFAIGVLAAASVLVSAFGLAIRPRSGSAPPDPATAWDPVRQTAWDKAYDWLVAKEEEESRAYVVGYTVTPRLSPSSPVPWSPPKTSKP